MSDAQSVDLPLVDLTIGIRAELSLADPDTCKFTVSRSLHPGGPFFFGNKERAAGSPLGERLFALPGVANVLIAECVVTIGKEPSASWSGLKSAIGTAIRTQLLTGVPAILKMAVDASTQERSDAELQAAVQELLDREVNRSIANHGGKISIVDVRQGKLGEKGRPGNRGNRGCDGPRSGEAAVLSARWVDVRKTHAKSTVPGNLPLSSAARRKPR
jgi:hypothetical protein